MSLQDKFNKYARKPDPKKLDRALQPPIDDTKENLHGYEVYDRFRPLEKLTDAATTDWVARQNKAFADFVAPAQATAEQSSNFIKNSIPTAAQESIPAKTGDGAWTFWRKAQKDEFHSLWIKDSLEAGAAARCLLDPTKIDPTGKTDVTGTWMTKDGKTLAYTLSKSGSDAKTLKFMDVATGQDFGPVYEGFRSGVQWDKDGQGFHYNRYRNDGSKTSEVMYHKMGDDPASDTVIYSPPQSEAGCGWFRLGKDSTDELGAHEWIYTYSASAPDKNGLLIRPAGSSAAFTEIFSPETGNLSPFAEINGRIYATTETGSPKGRIVSFDPADPAPEKWQTVVPESTDPLGGAFVWQGKVFATYSHDTGTVIKVFGLDGSYLHDVPVPALSDASLSGVRNDSKTCYLSLSNFQETGNVYTYDSDSNQIALFKKSIQPIDLKDCIVERVYATSKDGTQVPMTVIRHPGTQLDGTAATMLYGYGGFNVPLEPGFAKSIAAWVRAGGIYVQANLRGGGEYGQEWYDQGRLNNKQNVFDDFAACAEHLIKEKYTAANRLAINGGSNGGLLTVTTMIQRPELFGAVISAVPVTDMFRFHVGSHYGYSWKSDYGDPGIKADFEVAAAYSPLHSVPEGFKHPPLLLNSDANDDRVLPWHSYKMAATMQTREDEGSTTLLRVRNDGGHGAGVTPTQYAKEIGEIHAFLTRALGPIDQNAYKASLKKGGNDNKPPKNDLAA